MIAGASQTPNTAPGSLALRSFRDVCQTAIRVFNLMDKHRTAPFPNAYAVLFAYTSGSDEALVADVNSLLMLKDQLSPYDIETLYQEHLSDETSAIETQGIGQAIGNEISTVLEIIEKGLKQNDAFTSSLDTFAGQAPQATTGEGLAAVVDGLLTENRRMADLTRELNHGLSASQGLICQLNTQLEEIQAQASRDPVTDLPNRRAFETRLEEIVSRAAKTNEGFCLVLADIDSFRAFNNAHGMPAGDAVLKRFGSLLAASLSEGDMAARYGGDEFALILPGKELMPAYNLLISIKHALNSAEHVVDADKPVTGMTASFGLARAEPGTSFQQILREAGSHLEDAKKTGPNRVRAPGIV
ncbi:MAG: GGDEF domain-containing protein [Hyphomonas sp.]